MSIINILKFGLTSIAGVLFGYSTIFYLNQEASERNHFRQPSSVQFQKMGFDQLSKEYFDVQIKTVNIVEIENDTSQLKALVTAKKNIPQNTIQYHWKIKPEMNSKSSLIGYLPEMKKGDTFEIDLYTDGFSKSIQKHIQILFIGQIESHNIHRIMTLASRPEDSLEYMIANDSVEKIDQIKDSKQKIKKMGLRNKFDPKKIMK